MALWFSFPCCLFLLSCEIHTANSNITPVHEHSLNRQRDRGSYFHLRIVDSCNILVAAGLLASHRTLYQHRGAVLKGPLDSGTPVTGTKVNGG